MRVLKSARISGKPENMEYVRPDLQASLVSLSSPPTAAVSST